MPPPQPVRGRPRRWTGDRLRGELEAFVGGRADWPSRRQFADAGQAALLSALVRRGGKPGSAADGREAERWRPRLGTPRMGHAVRARGSERRWTEDRIRTKLIAFIADRPDFPTHATFRAEGQGPLHEAARVYGGLAFWRAELGYVPRGPGRARGQRGRLLANCQQFEDETLRKN